MSIGIENISAGEFGDEFIRKFNENFTKATTHNTEDQTDGLATTVFDFNTDSNLATITKLLDSDVSVSITLPVNLAEMEGRDFNLKFIQDGFGNRRILSWVNATNTDSIVLSTAANAVDILCFTVIDGVFTFKIGIYAQ